MVIVVVVVVVVPILIRHIIISLKLENTFFDFVGVGLDCVGLGGAVSQYDDMGVVTYYL